MQALGMHNIALRRVDPAAVSCRLSGPEACGSLIASSGIKPMSPALEGGFFTTAPPEKSLSVCLDS